MVCFNVDVHLFLFSVAVLSSKTQTAAFFVRCHSSQSRYPSGLRLAPPPLQEEKKQLLHLQVLKLDSQTKPSFNTIKALACITLRALARVCVCVQDVPVDERLEGRCFLSGASDGRRTKSGAHDHSKISCFHPLSGQTHSIRLWLEPVANVCTCVLLRFPLVF